ncbi:MAG: hypothetical protein WC640_00925 [Candidatus Paceibacterota bacterium]|jgi:hypothetical protein
MISHSRKVFYLILGVDILLLISIGFLVWQIKEREVESVNALAQASLPEPSEEDSAVDSWSKLEPQIATLDSYFLSASTTVEFLERLESVAKLTKINLKINQAEAKDNLRLNFSTEGSFSAINQFSVLLEKFPYILRLERLDLRAGEKGSWKGDFVIRVITQNDSISSP